MNVQDITLSVDYHDEKCMVRRLDHATSQQEVQSVPTQYVALRKLMEETKVAAERQGGKAVWIQES